jgi:hypothetical protein
MALIPTLEAEAGRSSVQGQSGILKKINKPTLGM